MSMSNNKKSKDLFQLKFLVFNKFSIIENQMTSMQME